MLDLRGAQPEKPEFDFAGVIECPESLYHKLESGSYGLNTDVLYQQVDDFASEGMVQLLGLE